ncbi:hypothetical protein [Saccharopolyspora griseoalba]|uniref:SH3 domain-containing protein n=1 Tax=Saccharopolyspora griseoalba TaxID=1431848 RepID=A0ABW2LFP4_9PSEU
MAVASVLPLAGLGTHISSFAVEVSGALARAAERVPERPDADFLAFGARIREAPNTGSAVRGIGNPGDTATVHLRVLGESVRCADGTTDPHWFDLTDRRTGLSGFVSGCLVQQRHQESANPARSG